MSPAALKRALDPAYIGSPFAQPFQFFDGDATTPMDLTGRAVVLFLDRQGLPDAHHEITGVIQTDGRVLFTVADTSAWIKGDYSLEVRLDGASVVVGRIAVAKGAGANGSDIVGAAQPPTAPGVVIAGSGVVQVVSVAPSGATDPSAIILPPDLSAALGGAETLADALLWLAQNGGTPSPILRDLIGNVVISSVATGALSVAAAGQVLLSGAISSVSSATGSLTVGAASSIALVGSAVSVSSLTGAMTIVRQVALAGTAAGSSVVSGSLSNTAPEVPYLPTTPAPQFATAMGRLWPSYTGPAAQISRTSDNTTLDLPTGADLVDMSGYAAFANATTTVAAKLYDQAYVVNGGAANTNDFVQATVASRPMVRPRNALRGRQTISMGTAPDGNTVQNRALRNATVVNQRLSVTRMWVGALSGGTINTLGHWAYGLSGNTSDTMSLCYNTQGDNANFFGLTKDFGPGTGGPPTAQAAVFTYQSGPAFQKMWINGQLVVNIAATTDTTMTGAAIGSGGWSGAYQCSAEFLADLSWPSILSDADRIAFESKLAAKFGTAYAPFTRCFSMEGDSMTSGMNETGFLINMGRIVQERYNDPLLKVPNFGGGGGTMAAMYASRAAMFAAAYSASFTKQAHQIWAGTNDIAALVSGSIVGGGANVWTNSLLPYIQYMTDPSRYGSKVIVATMIPRGWLGSSTDRAQREAERLSYNQLIRDNATTYGYTVADYGAMSQLVSGPNGGNPNYPNQIYYGTGSDVHLNPTGYQLCVDTVLGPILDTMLA